MLTPRFVTSALDGSEWSASRPSRFTLGGRTPGTQWIGGSTLWRREELALPRIELGPSSPTNMK
jgi:hypothetical protein